MAVPVMRWIGKQIAKIEARNSLTQSLPQPNQSLETQETHDHE